MAQILKAYDALSSSPNSNEVSSVLNSILSASPLTFDPSSRVQLIRNIITDLQACGSEAKLGSKDTALALLAIKNLGKDPAGSRYLASPSNLSILLRYASIFEDDHQASNEALRCVANALTLIDEARDTFITEEVNGTDICILKLEKSTHPDDIFVLSRILFLATASGTSYIETLIVKEFHGHTLVDIIVSKIDLLMATIQSNTASVKDALSDLLKFTNNILMYYTKGGKSTWKSSLDRILPPLLRAFQHLPESSPAPLTAPLTNVIHSLMYIPVTPSLRPVWFGPSREDYNRASSSASTLIFDILQRSYDLLDLSLSYYFPGTSDPDDCDLGTSGSLDDVLPPLAVLITHLCIEDETCRIQTRQLMIPDDLDRSSPLEHRPDILGKCLRLLTCASHPLLKDAIGEMLFAAADCDASKLSALVGYGNVAGHLFNKGIMSAPPPTSSTGSVNLTTPSGEAINPITGTTFQPKPEGPEMTQEEKEREAEKLFVLFDRLERNGALSPDQNPIRKAIHEGKLAL